MQKYAIPAQPTQQKKFYSTKKSQSIRYKEKEEDLTMPAKLKLVGRMQAKNDKLIQKEKQSESF